MAERSLLHLVWDWNGTVLNDFDVSFRSTNSSFRDAGLPEITTVTYRALLRSPIRSFYAAVLDREPTDEECEFLDGLPRLLPAPRKAGCAVAGAARSAARMSSCSGRTGQSPLRGPDSAAPGR